MPQILSDLRPTALAGYFFLGNKTIHIEAALVDLIVGGGRLVHVMRKCCSDHRKKKTLESDEFMLKAEQRLPPLVPRQERSDTK